MSAANVRCRSCNRGNANNEWNCNSSGYLNNNNANNSYAALPDCAESKPDKRVAHSAIASGGY